MVQIPTTERKYYNVTPKANTLSAYAGALLPAAQDLQNTIKEQQKIKISSLGLEARMKMSDATNQWRLDNESNPNNPAALKDLQNTYNSILGEYRGQIDPLYRSSWDIQGNKLKASFDLNNQEWGFKQRQINTENDIKRDMENYSKLAYEYGQKGSLEQATIDYQQSYDKLLDYGAKNLGTETAANMLSKYRDNFYSSYLLGAIETNPDNALQMLKTDDVKNVLEPYKIKQFEKKAEAEKKYLYKMQFDNDIANFTVRPTVEGRDAILARYPRMKKKDREDLDYILMNSPNYDAKNTFESVADVEDRIMEYADATYDSEEEAFNDYIKIVKGIDEANKRGKLDNKTRKKKQDQIADVLKNEAVRNYYSQVKTDYIQFLKDSFSLFSSPTFTDNKVRGKLRKMSTDGINIASTLIRMGDVEGARKIYKETRDNMIFYKNPELRGKKIGDKVIVNGRVYIFQGIDKEPILENK